MIFAKTALLALAVLVSSADAIKFPYTKCGNHGCKTIKTGLVIHGGSKNFSSIDFHQYGKTGLSMNTPGPVSRVYLTRPDGKGYEQFFLKNREISIDVNIAGVKCGYNAAWYFSRMDTKAKLGEGYCDAQGTCDEMDIIEANAGANSYAIHACNATSGACDPWGCGLKTYDSKIMNKVGPKGYIDTQKTYTITTAFHTDNGNDFGTLNSIVQTFSQGKRSYTLPASNQTTCAPGKYWPTTGEFAAFSKAWDKGMTMIFSYWGSGTPDGMSWLDGGLYNNPACNMTVGANHAMLSNVVVRPITSKKDDHSGHHH